MSRPPLHDVAHLAYLELLTPEFDKSVWFFTEVLGLTVVSSEGSSASAIVCGVCCANAKPPDKIDDSKTGNKRIFMFLL